MAMTSGVREADVSTVVTNSWPQILSLQMCILVAPFWHKDLTRVAYLKFQVVTGEAPLNGVLPTLDRFVMLSPIPGKGLYLRVLLLLYIIIFVGADALISRFIALDLVAEVMHIILESRYILVIIFTYSKR